MNRTNLMIAYTVGIVAVLLLLGCSEPLQESETHYTNGQDVAVKPRGERLLGFGVTEGSVGYEVAFGTAKSAGIQFIEIPQHWDEVEQSPGKFDSPFLTIANEFYPSLDTAIVLSINPIDTVSLRVPKRLVGKPFDDAEVINEFNKFVDFVFAELPDAQIVAVSIGNEVDGWLADDAQKWSEYARFVAAVSKHIRTINPDVPIGVKTTWPATVNTQKNEVELVNKNVDAVMVTYYPLHDDFTVRSPTVISDELLQLVKVAGEKPIFLLETGYPSGKNNQSSQEQQAEFVDAIFSAWDQYADSIRMVNFVWLHDVSDAEVSAMTKYYATENSAFASFLATLGLRTYNGKDKLAFKRIKQCAKVRGWK